VVVLVGHLILEGEGVAVILEVGEEVEEGVAVGVEVGVVEAGVGVADRMTPYLSCSGFIYMIKDDS
jgi:hypothetical protein